MSLILEMTAPLIATVLCIAAIKKDTDIFSALRDGAGNGLRIISGILPALLALFPAIYLFRVSGLPELLEGLLAPVLGFLGIPAETSLLVLLRPISGSASLAAASEIITQHGPDSLIGRTAAVMSGASETSLYVAALYFSAANVKDSRWAIPAALCADLACFIASSWICRVFCG
ncbi:MAG: spore maturation protein [Oscillospiraceae bacterium]|nr:spore maturation protein [Oscillospiraceae bacterium]